MRTIVFQYQHPSHWISEDGHELITRVKKLLELRSENDIQLHVKEVGKRGTRIEIGNSGCNLVGFDLFQSETLVGLKRIKHKNLEDMVYRVQLTYDEIVVILDVIFFSGSFFIYTLSPGIYQIADFISILKSLLPKEVEVNINIDDNRLRSNLTTNKTIRFTKKSFSIQ